MGPHSYNYKPIKELEPGSGLQYFYGKIVYIAKKDNQLVILLKDETGSIFLDLTLKDYEELHLELRQVLRVHRCTIVTIEGLKKGSATVGVNGCHIVVWAEAGDANKPFFISSRKWTKCDEDQEKIRSLSELNRSPITFDELVSKTVSNFNPNQSELNPKLLTNWWDKTRIAYKNRLVHNIVETLVKPCRTRVESTYRYAVDNSYFKERRTDEIIKIAAKCPNCFEEHSLVEYVSNGNVPECSVCKKPMNNLKAAVRVRIHSGSHSIYFTIPIEKIKGGKCKHYSVQLLEKFNSDEKRHEFEEQMEEIREFLQKTLWNAGLWKIKGIVVSRSENPKSSEIFLENVNFFDLVKRVK